MLGAAGRAEEDVQAALERLEDAEALYRRADRVHADMRRRIGSDHYFSGVEATAHERGMADAGIGLATVLSQRARLLRELGYEVTEVLAEAAEALATAEATGNRLGSKGRTTLVLARRAKGHLAAARGDARAAVEEWTSAAAALREVGLHQEAEHCVRAAMGRRSWPAPCTSTRRRRRARRPQRRRGQATYHRRRRSWRPPSKRFGIGTAASPACCPSQRCPSWPMPCTRSPACPRRSWRSWGRRSAATGSSPSRACSPGGTAPAPLWSAHASTRGCRSRPRHEGKDPNGQPHTVPGDGLGSPRPHPGEPRRVPRLPQARCHLPGARRRPLQRRVGASHGRRNAAPAVPRKQDVFPLFRQPSLVRAIVKEFSRLARGAGDPPSVIVGLDARGFLLGPLVALELDIPFVPIRKAGKLPCPCHSIESEKEYGKDELHLPRDSIPRGGRAVVVDDLLATGGTLASSCQLVASAGGTVSHCIVLVTIAALAGGEAVRQVAPGTEVHSLVDV